MPRSRRWVLLPLFTLLAVLLLCGSAFAATGSPVLLLPVSSSASSTPLEVSYELPEAAAPGTATLIFTRGEAVTTVTLGSAEDSAGEHTILLATHDLTASRKSEVQSALPSANLADGVYEVVLAYQNVALESAATAKAKEVRLDTATAAPELTAPKPELSFEGAFAVSYELPEAALSGSVALMLEGEEVGTSTLVLANSEKGAHTVKVNPADPVLEAGVFSGPQKLAAGVYRLRVEYQDALGNPLASSAAIKVTLLPAKCNAGSYSESGRVPCSKASPGHYAEGAGATVQIACEAGTFDAFAGSASASACVEAAPGHYVAIAGASEELGCAPGTYTALTGRFACTQASPGHYVPEAVATAQLECPEGYYSDVSEAESCELAPEGHYSPAGSAVAIPCPPGTSDADRGGGSAGACVPDLPGYYSGLGAPAATACQPGSFAAKSESFECTPAEPGYYVETEHAGAQLPCPPGSYAPFTGAVHCALAPIGTYAPEGARAPIACPAGTEAAAEGRSACTAVVKAPGTAVSPPAAPAGSSAQPALKCTLGAPPRQSSLGHRGQQAYRLSCTLTTTVSIRAYVTISSGRHRLKLAVAPSNVATLAGKTTTELLAVKLSKAAHALLGSPAARVAVTISVYGAPAGAKATRLSTVTLTGRR